MKIQPFQAAEAYSVAKSALRSDAPQSQVNAGAAFDALEKLAGVIEQSEKASIGLMTGSADPHSVVEAIAAAELAIETAVTIRDKVVEAYQELLRMPV
ncbi:MAG: flagellar hook-basal body complex protein FliE [Parvularculaceae bacterium]